VTEPPLEILRSPDTGETLRWVSGGLVGDSVSYPVVGGVPVLLPIDGHIPIESIQRLGEEPNSSLTQRAVRALWRSRSPVGNSADRYRRFIAELGAGRVLVVGGGMLGMGSGELLGTPSIELIETDIYIGPRTRIVCDAHQLPFADDTFDGVIIQAVLEHVLDPAQVVSEIRRVLRKGGVVYAETPFMQQVHEGAYDFTRWTEVGHRRLFRDFTAIETGVTAGPAVVLLWSIAYFARALGRTRSTQIVLEQLSLALFGWLKHFDRRLVVRPTATDSASGVYFLGRLAEKPVSDHEVVGTYSGAMSVGTRRARKEI
jgi:SAM-dependent methyltransferase